MSEYYKCLKIESSFRDDYLNLPKKGECKLFVDFEKNYRILFLKIQKDKIFFDQSEND